jgi:hypothetical protein
MARTRYLKPEFFRDAKVLKCSPLARLLFAGLWTVSDRDGRVADDAEQIKLDILPGDSVKVDELLGELTAAGLIERWVVDGTRVIGVRGFAKHQRPHTNEPASELPEKPRQSADSGHVTRTRTKNARERVTPSSTSTSYGQSTGGAGGEIAPDNVTPIDGRRRALRGPGDPPEPFDLLVALGEAIDLDVAEMSKSEKAKQLRAAKELISSGILADDIPAMVRYVSRWATGIDLVLLNSQSLRWKSDGRPDGAPARRGDALAAPVPGAPGGAAAWAQVEAFVRARRPGQRGGGGFHPAVARALRVVAGSDYLREIELGDRDAFLAVYDAGEEVG